MHGIHVMHLNKNNVLGRSKFGEETNTTRNEANGEWLCGEQHYDACITHAKRTRGHGDIAHHRDLVIIRIDWPPIGAAFRIVSARDPQKRVCAAHGWWEAHNKLVCPHFVCARAGLKVSGREPAL